MIAPSTTPAPNLLPSPERFARFPNVLFFTTLVMFLFSIALVRFMVAGVPVRALLSVVIFAMVFAPNPALLVEAMQKMGKVLVAITYAAILGFVVSLFNDLPVNEILRQIVEIHVQSMIGTLTGYGLYISMGAKRLVRAFVWVVILSSIVAVMQAANIGFAWGIRDYLQTLQSYEFERIFLNLRLRAMGLSFSPVHLGTQICLAFAVIYSYLRISHPYEPNSQFQKRVWIPIFLALAVMIASGNRSPMLGLGIFLGLYLFYSRPLLALFLGAIFIPVAVVIYANIDAILDYMVSTGIRAFRVGDKSSVGRAALREYGWLLFKDQPFGYGLIFSSIDRVGEYWYQLSHLPNAQTVWGNAVHNYYLNMIHKYGLLILPLAFYLLIKLLKHKHILFALIAYAIHIFYHNDGPLFGDFMIWYFMPLFATLMRSEVK